MRTTIRKAGGPTAVRRSLAPAFACLVVLAALPLAGCVTMLGPEQVRRDLSHRSGVRLDPELKLTVNRGGMWLARMGLRMSGETDFTLDGIRHVDVGIYEVRGLRDGVEAPRPIGPEDFEGWTPITRVHEDGEHVLVLTRGRNGRIRQMLVVVAESDEWVIVRMKGDLEPILEQALAQAFEEVDRPELYQKTREERGLDAS